MDVETTPDLAWLQSHGAVHNKAILQTVSLNMPARFLDHLRMRIDQQALAVQRRIGRRQPQRKPSCVAAKIYERSHGLLAQGWPVRLMNEHFILTAELVQGADSIYQPTRTEPSRKRHNSENDLCDRVKPQRCHQGMEPGMPAQLESKPGRYRRLTTVSHAHFLDIVRITR